MDEKPIPESYWVIPGRFLAGEYPALRMDEPGTRRRLDEFLKAGISTFIDLTGEGERPVYSDLLQELAATRAGQVDHVRFSFPDFSIPEPETMVAALDAIDAALDQGQGIYLHCVGGIGRTGTTVGCWLIRHGMKPAEALLQLDKLYHTAQQSLFVRRSPETEQQVQFILNWEEDGLA